MKLRSNIRWHWFILIVQSAISGVCAVEGVENWGTITASIDWLLAAFNMGMVAWGATRIVKLHADIDELHRLGIPEP